MLSKDEVSQCSPGLYHLLIRELRGPYSGVVINAESRNDMQGACVCVSVCANMQMEFTLLNFLYEVDRCVLDL